MASRTRNKSGCSLTNYLSKSGLSTPKELLATELPTMRAILQLGLHLQEERLNIENVDKRNYPISELTKDMSEAVLVTWVRANAQFKEPVISSKKSLANRIQKDWILAQKIANNNVSKKERDKFDAKLDKLYDITKCRCLIVKCSEFVSCSGLCVTVERKRRFLFWILGS